MFVHVGNGKSLKKRDIIGIFDLDTATVSKTTKVFLDRISHENKLSYDDYDLPRSFLVLVDDDGCESVKLSRISTLGLRMRAESRMEE